MAWKKAVQCEFEGFGGAPAALSVQYLFWQHCISVECFKLALQAGDHFPVSDGEASRLLW